jgi:Fis family transcriptional regulator, factor for inversion stimulation protein
MDKHFSEKDTDSTLGSEITLRAIVTNVMQHYFASLKGEEPRNVYDFFLDEIEEPLLHVVMKFTRGNQSEAARLLGLSRGTLRTKLKKFGLLN